MFTAINIIGILWIVFLIVWGISALFAKKSVVKRRFGWRFFFLIVIIVVILSQSPLSKDNLRFIFTNPFFNATQTISIMAIVIVAFGLAGAVWARIYLGKNWSGYVTYKKNHELVTSGPYRYVRHPIYSSMILMMIGTFLALPTVWISVLFVAYISIFLWRTKREEKIMIKLFGKKYGDYMKRTRKLIPWIY